MTDFEPMIEHFDSITIIEEIEHRYKFNQLLPHEKRMLISLAQKCNFDYKKIKITNLDEQMKLEVIEQYWNKYTSAELEERLKK